MGTNQELSDLVTKLTTLDTSINNVNVPHKVPSTATAIHAVNETVITGTTILATTLGRQIKAAVASKSIYITQLDAVNYTTTEDNAYLVYEGAASTVTTVIAVIPGQDVDGLTAENQSRYYSPPLKTTAGAAIFARALIPVTGDAYVSLNGFQQA